MKNVKKIVPTLLIASTLLLSGCAGKTGKVATNIDTSTLEILSQDSLDSINEDMIKKIRDYVKNAPSLSNVSISSELVKFNLEDELSKRKNSFVIADSAEKVIINDKVNLTFIDISLASGESTYDINLGYDFDLSSNLDSSFKDALIGKAVNEIFTIEKCKMPDGTEAKVKVKINYITRKVDNFDMLSSSLPEGAESYEKWLEQSLDKASIVDNIWSQVLKQAAINEDADGYKEYFQRKYSNAYEYYSFFNETVDEASLKEIIKEQVKKEFVAFYYANEYGIKLGENKDQLQNIALYYGYTTKAFEAKYSEEVIDSTMLIDMVGIKMLENYAK